MTTDESAPAKPEDWRHDMRCVIPGYFECAAKVPEACLCKKMPAAVYESHRNAKH